jgi:hypothetical protein
MLTEKMTKKLAYLTNSHFKDFGWMPMGKTGGPLVVAAHSKNGAGVQPLSKTAIHKAVYAFQDNASIKAYVLGAKVIFSSCQHVA